LAGDLTINTVIQINNLKTYIGGKWVHREVSFSVKRATITAIVGGSGCGKSVLLREILTLLKPAGGEIVLFGKKLSHIDRNDLFNLQQRCGILFQQGALFSSLNTLENIAFPLKHFTTLNSDTIQEIALLKLALVGLTPDVANKYPAELSGGMQKRVALARAIALDPELLFLDEPSAGLDPASAAAQDDLLIQLQRAMQLTVVMVTHDLNTLASIVDNIIYLGEGKVLAEGSYKKLQENQHPEIYKYFHTVRTEATDGAKR
jgi:phospholipid/cholesterol/gamma-HCH transport system ATP-binding protein